MTFEKQRHFSGANKGGLCPIELLGNKPSRDSNPGLPPSVVFAATSCTGLQTKHRRADRITPAQSAIRASPTQALAPTSRASDCLYTPKQTVDLRQSARPLRPPLDVVPVPNQCRLELSHGLGELGVPSAPVVDDLRSGDTQAFSDLMRTHEVFGVDPTAHRSDRTLPTSPASGCIRSYASVAFRLCV